MREEDVVNHIGRTDVVEQAVPQQHRHRFVRRADWATYMAEPLRQLWELIRNGKDADLLQRATYGDWEDFCWNFTRPQPQTFYSKRMCIMDGLH